MSNNEFISAVCRRNTVDDATIPRYAPFISRENPQLFIALAIVGHALKALIRLVIILRVVRLELTRFVYMTKWLRLLQSYLERYASTPLLSQLVFSPTQRRTQATSDQTSFYEIQGAWADRLLSMSL